MDRLDSPAVKQAKKYWHDVGYHEGAIATIVKMQAEIQRLAELIYGMTPMTGEQLRQMLKPFGITIEDNNAH